jgi:hypothetical protein
MVAKKDVGATEDVQVATSYDFSPDDAVTLIVGLGQKRMLVHSAYLTRDSDFFKAALKKEWVEGETRVIKLPEEDPERMAHYMTYVYHKKLPLDESKPSKREHYDARWPILIALYVCGEHFLNRTIQDAAIKEIIRVTRIRSHTHSRWFPTHENVKTVYRETPEGSPIRRLMVDLHILHGSKDWLSADAHAEFLMDMTKSLYDMVHIYNALSLLKGKDVQVENYVHGASWKPLLLT